MNLRTMTNVQRFLMIPVESCLTFKHFAFFSETIPSPKLSFPQLLVFSAQEISVCYV